MTKLLTLYQLQKQGDLQHKFIVEAKIFKEETGRGDGAIQTARTDFAYLIEDHWPLISQVLETAQKMKMHL